MDISPLGRAVLPHPSIAQVLGAAIEARPGNADNAALIEGLRQPEGTK